MKNIFTKKFFKKDIAVALCLSFILSICFSLAGFNSKCQNLRDNILRLHILANSNSSADQAIKIKVRDAILEKADWLYSKSKTKEDAICITKENISLLKNTAEEQIKQSNKNYNVKIEIGKSYFNTREYDDFTLPAGEYDAVKILIGKAEGKNWWCVMFPALCLPAAEKGHSLNEAVNSQSAQIAQNPTEYKIEFKIIEVFEKIRNIFSKI